MRVTFSGAPAYTLAYCSLSAGEAVRAERGALVAMSAGIEASAGIAGGVAQALIRKGFGAEDFFSARYVATAEGAWVALAPRYPGDMTLVNLEQTGPLLVEAGAMIGFEDTVSLSTRIGSLGTVVMHQGATALYATGTGQLLLGSYGALSTVTLGAGETVVVDTGHLLAWSRDMSMKIGPIGGVVTSVVTGEGMVAELTGPGTLWIQSRAEQNFRDWVLFRGGAQNTGRYR
jgi:uncharacterized protein (TIGR00266 family)